MPSPALKEWAVTIEALLRGEQVLILRKGGIGEKRFEIPHDRFLLYPSHLHQRPELVVSEARGRFADALGVDEEPEAVTIRAWAKVHEAHAIEEPAALQALSGLHILSEDYAAERLRCCSLRAFSATAGSPNGVTCNPVTAGTSSPATSGTGEAGRGGTTTAPVGALGGGKFTGWLVI